MTLRVILALHFCGILSATSFARAGEDDLRDVVVPVQGVPVRGRVLTPYAKEEIVILQGGKRVRVERSNVQSMTTVNDHLREFLDRFDKVASAGPGRLWGLAAWATERRLDAMARLVAYRVLLADPEHEGAHEMLGHRKAPRGWLWRRDERYFPKDRLDEYVGEWGHALEIDSEHWAIRTDAGVERALDTLLDLERLYLFLHDSYGWKLDLYEAVSPMQVFAWKDADEFPGYTELRIPYYAPSAGAQTGEGAYVFFEEGAPRAKDLFRVGTEAILNSCLAYDATYSNTENRLVPWFEIGFGQGIQSQLEGEPGRARARAPAVDPKRAKLVLEGRRYRLTNLLNRDVGDGYYDVISEHKEAEWAYPHLYVADSTEHEEERLQARAEPAAAGK
jgi:hypothetical protein